MNRSHKISILLASSAALFCPNAHGSSVPTDEALQFFQQEAEVITASKSEMAVANAPSPITVWTAADIERMGIRTIKELLERTAGFFPSIQQANEVLGARGIIADGNEAFLLLIDGHSLNSIVRDGMGSYYTFPLLSKVKQVEIIRGPGSTLWGSDAALGVINVITKKGTDVNGVQVTADYATGDTSYFSNLLYGKALPEGGNFLYSFTYLGANGYPHGHSSNQVTLFSPADVAPLGAQAPSWEMFGKMEMGNNSFRAGAADLVDIDLQGGTALNTAGWNRRKIAWGEAAHKEDFSNSLSLESKLFFDMNYGSNITVLPTLSKDVSSTFEDQLGREQSIGADLLLSKDFHDKHHLKVGARFVQVDIDPVYNIVNVSLNGGLIGVYTIPTDQDRTLSSFIEDEWHVTRDLDLIAGVRADHNDLRERNTKISPRGAVVYRVNENWTAKYLYNTGNVRPSVFGSFLGQNALFLHGDGSVGPQKLLGEEQSEVIRSHDIQAIYGSNKFNFTADLFQLELDHFFNFSGQKFTAPDGTPYLAFQVNTNNILSRGLELDFRHKLTESVNWYGNYSHLFLHEVNGFDYSLKGIPLSLQGSPLYNGNRTTTGYPADIWNVGFNVALGHKVTANLHERGWANAWTQDPATGGYVKVAPEHFVDVNFLFKEFAWAPNLSVDLFVKNIFDNVHAAIPLAVVGGTYPAMGISFGTTVAYKF